MGTNYYVNKEDICEYCGRGGEELHIGKSSAGWHFGLHVIPNEGINNLEDWKKFWKGKRIRDEYGRTITAKEMLKVITERKSNNDWNKKPFMYNGWVDFHNQNNSERGINGLVRCKIGSHCIGHGEGTWDLITGEFS